MSQDEQPQDNAADYSEESIEDMLDYITSNALMDMIPDDPKLDADAEAKLATMDDKTMHYEITYNPCLVWMLDMFELRCPCPPSVNLSSFKRHPCQDPHWMKPE